MLYLWSILLKEPTIYDVGALFVEDKARLKAKRKNTRTLAMVASLFNYIPIANVFAHIDQAYAKSNSLGDFSIFVNSTMDSIKATYPNDYVTIQPSGYSITSAVDGYDFGVYFEPGHKDLKLDLASSSIFHPGFPNKLLLTIKNVGKTTQKPLATIILDDNVEYIYANPTPTTLTNTHHLTRSTPHDGNPHHSSRAGIDYRNNHCRHRPNHTRPASHSSWP